jgi:hypothetical protein
VEASKERRAVSTEGLGLQFAGAVTAQRAERTVAMEFFRAYRPLTVSNATFEDVDSSALGRACVNSDMLISNFGIHWNLGASKGFEEDIGRFLDYLSHCIKRGGRLKTLIWVEPHPQHFVGPNGDFRSVTFGPYTEEDMEQFARGRNMTMGELNDADSNGAEIKKCWPHQHIHGETHAVSWRRTLFQKALRDRGMGWDSMGMYGADVGSMAPAVHILPTYDFMSDLYYMHPGECTHWCYTPLLYEPIWHRLHDILDNMPRS